MGETIIEGRLNDIFIGFDIKGRSQDEISKMIIGLPVEQQIDKNSIETIGRVIDIDWDRGVFIIALY